MAENASLITSGVVEEAGAAPAPSVAQRDRRRRTTSTDRAVTTTDPRLNPFTSAMDPPAGEHLQARFPHDQRSCRGAAPGKWRSLEQLLNLPVEIAHSAFIVLHCLLVPSLAAHGRRRAPRPPARSRGGATAPGPGGRA